MANRRFSSLASVILATALMIGIGFYGFGGSASAQTPITGATSYSTPPLLFTLQFPIEHNASLTIPEPLPTFAMGPVTVANTGNIYYPGHDKGWSNLSPDVGNEGKLRMTILLPQRDMNKEHIKLLRSGPDKALEGTEVPTRKVVGSEIYGYALLLYVEAAPVKLGDNLILSVPGPKRQEELKFHIMSSYAEPTGPVPNFSP